MLVEYLSFREKVVAMSTMFSLMDLNVITPLRNKNRNVELKAKYKHPFIKVLLVYELFRL